MYLAARFASNPEPPELKSASISIPAPHGAIPARIYTPKRLRKTTASRRVSCSCTAAAS